MDTLPESVNSASFIELMKEIWEGAMEPAPDGGVVCYFHPLYDKWHHARKTAFALGGYRTGGTVLDGIPAQLIAFPADPKDRVIITNDGSMVAPSKHFRHSPKRPIID